MKNRESGFASVELLMYLAVFMVVIGLFYLANGVNFSNGSGQRVGHIVRINKQGFQYKTWEAQLVTNYSCNGGGSFEIGRFNFTIEDNALLNKVEEYMKSQAEVVIVYEVEGTFMPSRSSSDGRFLKSISPLTK